MSPFRRRPARALLLAAAALSPLALAAPASAVDAPTRIVDLDEAGQRASGTVAAVAPGAREVLLMQPDSPQASWPQHLAVRDLVTAQTRSVLSSSVGVYAISDDTQRILISTETSYDAADANGKLDLYVYDRPTARGMLATRGLNGQATGAGAVQAALSGDGKVVTFSNGDSGTLRVNVDTGAVQKITSARQLSFASGVDRTGSVVATEDGIYVGTSRVPNPGAMSFDGLYASKVADGGSVMALLTGYQYTAALKVIDLTTGVARTISLPSWVQQQFPQLIDVNADGTKALVAISLSRGSALGLRLVLGTVDLRTGAIAQLGNDLPWSGARYAAVTPDWAFAGTGQIVAQLGTTPIPGANVVVPPIGPRPAIDYLTLHEGCKGYPNRWPPITSIRPSLELRGAQGLSPQVPAKAEVTVTNRTSGAITNKFTLSSIGARRDLTTGFGNFIYSVKVTFRDGTSVNGSQTVPAYTPASCPVLGF